MTILSKCKTGNLNPSKPFRIAFTNIRGLRANFSDLETYLFQASPDILAISETCLTSDVADDDFSVPGYLPIKRKDSLNGKHGLAVYLKSTLPISRQEDLELPDSPFMCFRLSLLHSTSYLFVLYRSPSNQDCSVLDNISDSIDRAISSHPSANIYVCGDFNSHHKDWLPNHIKTDQAGRNAQSFAISHNLSQMVDFITRIPDNENHNPSTLDLFLSSKPEICNVSSAPPFGNSDHVLVSVDISVSSPASYDSPIHRTLYSFDRGDWDSFRDFIRDAPWNEIFELKAEQCAAEIASWIKAGIDAFIPCRKFQSLPNSSPWFSPACAAAIAHRNHFYKLYHNEANPENTRLFRQARNHCKNVLKSAKLEYAQRTKARISEQKIGSRDFWRIYKRVLNKGASPIPPLFNGPEVLSSAPDKAELFAKIFATNSNIKDDGVPLPDFDTRTDIDLTSLDFSVKTISSIISNLDPTKATGPDGIPVVLLQKCSPELSPVLAKLFRKCFAESCFPSCWKRPSVIPVFKNSGERSNPSNYRPISILPIISKVFEIVINSSLIKHLETNKLLSDHQYGFRSERSTADLLTVITERIHQALDVSGEARAIALDISKAFDKVWHRGLIHKLQAYGISGPFLNIIKSFLSHRSIQVVLSGSSSKEHSINAGVPQGSVLGPTLFLIFINDLPDDLFCKLGIFADDTTLYSSVGKSSGEFEKIEMAADLEADLRSVTEWGERWLVTFNASKTKLLSINRRKCPDLPEIFMDHKPLPESQSFRLLGLPFCSSLGWSQYIENIAKAASKKIGSLHRAKNFLTPESILYLYKSTIRPCLEYCCHIWSGAPITSLNILDKVQRRLYNLLGENLFSKLQPLSHRRDVASLSLFYRYFHGHCSEDLASLMPRRYSTFNSSIQTHRSVRNNWAVYLPRRNTSTYSNSFIPRTATLWNSIPDSCFPSNYNLDLFKKRVHKYLLD